MKKEYSVREIIPKVAPFVRPFVGLIALSFLANLIFSLVNASVLAIVEPIFRTLFGGGGEGVFRETAPALNKGFGSGLKAWFDEFIYSTIVGPNLYDSIRNLSVLIFILFVIRGLAKYFGNLISVRMEEGIMKNVRDALFVKVTDLSMAFFARKRTGEVISLLTNDVGVLNHATINSVTTLWREATTIIIYVVILMAISAKLTLIAVSISVLGFLLIRTSTSFLRRYGSRMQSAQADYTSTLQETVLGIRVVKALNVESTMVERFKTQTAHYVRMALRNTRISGLVPVVNDTFGILALVSVFFAGGMALASHEIEPSSLVTFLFLLFGLMQPITTIVGTIAGMQRGIAAASNVVGVLDEDPSIVSGTTQAGVLKKELVVDNLTFSYGDGPVLHDVSFTLHKGETIALVGASGSGKSTMLDLLLRFYDPQQGRILVDATDIRSLELLSYRKLFGMVSQETILFNDTVANNITLGLTDVSTERIEQAARIAHADGFIRQLPDGYNTPIGDRGMRLSGGQRQRLAIARAVVREPQILLFDEATSALDTESERIVQEAIADVLADRTAIIVAHRLSTIANADRILVFDQGRIVEVGRHSELLALNGVYAKLHALQFVDHSNSERSTE